jgi:predicted dehydrogenase
VDEIKAAVAVVGRGSAASRTIRLLLEQSLAHRVVQVSSQPSEIDGVHHHSSLDDLTAGEVDWVFDCSPASSRVPNAKSISKIGAAALLEKPLGMSAKNGREIMASFEKEKLALGVGYNLRSLDAFAFVKRILGEGILGNLESAQVSVGQYLPDWRPGRDYRSTTSARADLGGGVLLELSHEINYVVGILGNVTEVTGQLSHSGELELDVEDSAKAILMVSINNNHLPVEMSLDFLKKVPERWCLVYGSKGQLHWDLLANTVTVESLSGVSKVTQFSDGMQKSYISQIRDMNQNFARGWDGESRDNQDALHTLDVIDAWRKSSQLKSRVAVREMNE